jgi:hypothetical protein
LRPKPLSVACEKLKKETKEDKEQERMRSLKETRGLDNLYSYREQIRLISKEGPSTIHGPPPHVFVHIREPPHLNSG